MARASAGFSFVVVETPLKCPRILLVIDLSENRST